MSEKSLKFSIYQRFSNKTQTCEIGRVVKGYRSTHFFEGQKRWNHLFNVMKLYLVNNWSGSLSGSSKETPVKKGLFLRYNGNTAPLPVEGGELSFAETEQTKKIVVSDFDDTIIKSRAVSLKRLIATTLFKPIGSREVFPEVSEAYQRFQKGESGGEENLFFYISSSTWNIYPLVKGFLDHSLLPSGIILLKEMDFGNTFESELRHSHKLKKIQFLLDFFPDQQFILIGDAGQEDAKIYASIANKNPTRISKILIRFKWWEKLLEESPLEERVIDGQKLLYFKDLNQLLE